MVSRGVIRLLVPSPDRRRVLARPNGLAGWTLPTVAVEVPFDGWDAKSLARVADVLGTPVTPGPRLGPTAWVVEPSGRVPTAGNTWIASDDVGRLGADANLVRDWFGRTVE